LEIPGQAFGYIFLTAMQHPSSQLKIELVDATHWPQFFEYLEDQLQDNGLTESGYFQPIAKSDLKLSQDRRTRFSDAARVPVGDPGWRRFWIATDGTDIFGHVDLRAHFESYARHRCILGIGVHRAIRRSGLGRRLLQHAIDFAASVQYIEWLDLQVLSVNSAAIALYASSDFVKTGEHMDLHRFDGLSFASTSMSHQIHRASNV
jgi:ribosomal protein S18 acetylase RimI-like enzyme